MLLYELFEDWDNDRYEDGRKFWREVGDHYKGGTGKNLSWRPEFSSWPPSQKELLETDRKIKQEPEWLAYYAYFQWRSWQQPEFKFMKDWEGGPKIIFYNVPMIANYNGEIVPDRGRLMFDAVTGKIIERPTEFSKYEVYLPSALQACKDLVAREIPKIKSKLAYLTGNYYIRFGRWREDEQSNIHDYGKIVGKEAGVSVYHAVYDLEEDRWEIDPSVEEAAINGTLQSFIYERSKRIFLVQGRELNQTGADGEPLLKDVKLVKELKYGDVYVGGIFDPREDDAD